MPQKKINTTDDWLKLAIKQLEAAGIGTARLDCLVLLEDVLKQDRAWILAHTELTLSNDQTNALNTSIARRATHEPLAYIRESIEFYGRDFFVDERVLVPRPESETMIELLLAHPTKDHEVIADVGTGSGALALTVKLERPQWIVVASDNDRACLEVAQHNAKTLNVDVHFVAGDLLSEASLFNPTIAIANLPYVPNSHTINQAAMIEPAQAIFGGEDGLDIYRRLFDQLSSSLTCKLLLTESLPFQHDTLATIASQHGWELSRSEDFIQLFTR